MPQIIIDGQVHEAIYVEYDEKGRCGIVTDKQTFWLKPVCGFKGEAVEEWPKMPPVEITALSLVETDPPRSFICRLQTAWQKYRQLWMASTPKERSKLVGMFIGHDRYGSWIRPDHKTPNLSWPEFKQAWFEGRGMMVIMGMTARGLKDAQSLRELTKIRNLAEYSDKAGTKIFLEAVEPAAHSREEAQEVRARKRGEAVESGSEIKTEIQKVGEAVQHGTGLIAVKLDVTHGAVAELCAEQAGVNKQAAKERAAIKAGVEEVNKLTPAVSELIDKHEELQAATQSNFDKAVREALQEMQLEPLEREIISLRWNRNFAHDKIVEELRKQGRGKTKKYVIEVCRRFDTLLTDKGYKGKRRVTGPALPPEHGLSSDGDSAIPVAIENETPSSKLDKAEMENFIERWPKMPQVEREEVLRHYPEIKPALKQQGYIEE